MLLTSLMCWLRCRFSDWKVSRLSEMFCVMSVTKSDAPVSSCSIMFLSSLSCPLSFSNSLFHCVRWNLLDKNAGSGPILMMIICIWYIYGYQLSAGVQNKGKRTIELIKIIYRLLKMSANIYFIPLEETPYTECCSSMWWSQGSQCRTVHLADPATALMHMYQSESLGLTQRHWIWYPCCHLWQGCSCVVWSRPGNRYSARQETGTCANKFSSLAICFIIDI